MRQDKETIDAQKEVKRIRTLRIRAQSEEDRHMRQDKETFDAQKEVKRIRALRIRARRQRYRKSRLERYRAELAAMRKAGASCGDLAIWLRVTHRCKINRSSVDRYLKKLPEMNSETVKTDQHTPRTE
ncbi:MAG: hypothetical protein RBS57_11425 [Desulforhabdus sp.]|nr:hypothetical protein [Desulforhabdus sp.]